MVKKIEVISYRKLKDTALEFTPGITAISGTNGTCKTSLLHMIGNSFQKVTTKDPRLSDNSCLAVINRLNATVNPKIEALTRGDKIHNDPGNGAKGTLFKVHYDDGTALEFRKHNSKNATGDRFSIKPYYKENGHESLPAAPVVYLSLARLFPYGEFLDDDKVSKIQEKLPQAHLDTLFDNYKTFTGIEVSNPSGQKMGGIKTRVDFSTSQDGIDSNTISAGEDNLFIILLALQTLAYYCECLVAGAKSEAILLIDEIDATLHPSFQIKLSELFAKYCEKYPIQVIFTTHSLTLLEQLLKENRNVIYFRDNLTSVLSMPNPDMYKIRMDLQQKTHREVYLKQVVPVFTEDEEARFFIDILFDFFEKNTASFAKVRRTIHLVECTIGSNNLLSLFKDSVIRQSTMASICVLDGDQTGNPAFNVVALPGGEAPESFIYRHCEEMFAADDPFWSDEFILSRGYSKTYYLQNIKQRYEEVDQKIEEARSRGESTAGMRRKYQKAIFHNEDVKEFFGYAFINWLNSPDNQTSIRKFFKAFHSMYLRVIPYHGIDAAIWPKEESLSLPNPTSQSDA